MALSSESLPDVGPTGGAALAARVVGTLFNASLWAMAIALLFSRWTWFEMRVNVGWVLFGTWIVLIAMCLWRVKKPFGVVFSLINSVVCGAAIVFLSHGLQGVSMLPASLVREGLKHPEWPIGTINIILASFLVVLFVAIVALRIARRGAGGRGAGVSDENRDSDRR